MTTGPEPPAHDPIPDVDPNRFKLYEDVKVALQSIPVYFSSGTHIEGLEAGDLFNLNAVLGSSIEIQVVETLNRIRRVWDPDNEWIQYRFERSSQTFPDVRLVAAGTRSVAPVLGVELKGWYLLAREGEPSFRYSVSPKACSVFDLLLVVPWHLKNVLSGVPIVYEPYIEQARYVAEYRNFWWQHVRRSGGDRGIEAPLIAEPYPPPKVKINDVPVSDAGGNFGRVARIGVMNAYVQEMLGKRVAGIEARHWVQFFKAYAESVDPEEISRKLAEQLSRGNRTEAAELEARIVALTQEIFDLLK